MEVTTFDCRICGKTYLRKNHRNVHEGVAHRDYSPEEARP